ncbi:hypothetical protein CERZMDRAFT_39560 [Cercospora zeae-maydis SCOH1-5]|uniref:Uncharacterized protein n=1 Tax=Cercospora zeae-maydis SCOH1-5 TaxID=717836 RepID=A0A6A6FJY1_9PEZI|nr:hypothetical protein CERZMDRAFT_39560 [Cercospora zeae-maydis SCOH1-5]
MCTTGHGRRPFVTSHGHLAIGPESLRVGDYVVIILGAGVPHVVRAIDGHADFILVGEAYTHGCMDGEAAEPGAIVQSIELH